MAPKKKAGEKMAPPTSPLKTAVVVVVFAVLANLGIMILLVGGIGNMQEVVEAKFLPALPAHSTDHLKGKNVIITGANRGYGKAAAQHFLEAGAKVIILCRSGIPAVGVELQNITGVDKSMIEMLKVDMGDFSSIDLAVKDMATRGIAVDYLVLNAATVASEPRKDSFGVGQMFAVNYLGNVVLVNELNRHDMLNGPQHAHPSKVLVIGSGSYREGHKGMFGAFDDWNMLQAMEYYGQTKVSPNKLRPCHLPMPPCVTCTCPSHTAASLHYCAAHLPMLTVPTALHATRHCSLSPRHYMPHAIAVPFSNMGQRPTHGRRRQP
jgi:NAD(P)-dependent dehydrogenase (short-subunit alcohol dehydrogenase family)